MFSIGVFAIILDNAKRILLCHRTDHDLWNLPGGTLESAETVEECVVREVKEETGLDVVVSRLAGVYTKKEKNEVVFSFVCTVVGGEITLNDEADKVEYFELNAIPRNFSPKQRERLQDYFDAPDVVHYKVQEGKGSIELLKEGLL